MTAGFDPATARIVWTSPIYTTGSAKLTSTVTNKIFLEGGVSTNYERYNTLYQPGIEKSAARPSGTRRSTSRTPRSAHLERRRKQRGMYPDRFAAMGSVSYVTGAHNIKVGVQDTWGRYRRFRSANGDLRANFQNGRAFQAGSSTRRSASKTTCTPTSASTGRIRGRSTA